jgi:hypothetical protein
LNNATGLSELHRELGFSNGDSFQWTDQFDTDQVEGRTERVFHTMAQAADLFPLQPLTSLARHREPTTDSLFI